MDQLELLRINFRMKAINIGYVTEGSHVKAYHLDTTRYILLGNFVHNLALGTVTERYQEADGTDGSDLPQKAFHGLPFLFNIRFKNGYMVTIGWGPLMYADNDKVLANPAGDRIAAGRGSDTAECSVWNSKGEMVIRPEWGEGPTIGHQTAEQVLDLLNWASEQKEVK